MARVIVVGAGLVGPVIAMSLAKLGHSVEVWEKRPDPRKTSINAGSSVNLTLCRRGIVSLASVCPETIIRKMCVPIYGRLIHDIDGRTSFQSYGNRREAIYSISRAELNKFLLDEAERVYGIPFNFNHTCINIDPRQPAIVFENTKSGKTVHGKADVICAADGVHSSIRTYLYRQGLLEYSAEELDQGYKEISILPDDGSRWHHNKEVLHLWPRHTYMLIGFPNTPGDITGALHLPFHGEVSFAHIQRPRDIIRLFEESFPDILPYVPNLVRDFFSRPVNKMTTIRCAPWHFDGKVVLLGDAAHAIYPVYGQGANAGFEDCRILVDILHECGGNWSDAFHKYCKVRKRDMDAIAGLCMNHSVELRDHVVEKAFQLRKDVERKVNELLPDRYLPLYSMISFTLMSYADAVQASGQQDVIIDRLMAIENLEEKLSSREFERVILDTATSIGALSDDC
jgi:kynurenine 3-monooxygenase